MTQPQNPQSPPLLARFSVNNDGLDLLQVLNSGSGVIWRLNQFQATWYVGSGAPIFIPGELPGNLYLDNTSGNIWQLQLNLTWLELPAPGGGGGGGVTSLNSLTGVINILAGSGIGTTIAGNNIDITNTGVLSVNSLIGNPTIAGGTGIIVNTAGSNINVINSGLLSLNAITGAATAAAGAGISITPSGNTLTFGNSGVISLNGISGAPVLAPGVGISVTPSGSNLGIANTGVLSINGLTGNPSIIPGSGTTVNVAGGNIQISASGTGRTPWVDIQNFGSLPKRFAFNQPTASATTTASSPNVTISSGTFSSALINGQGVCIPAGGANTSQSTPSAPTVTSPAVQGSQTLTYEIVGYDNFGGLTAASASATVTNAPAVFGPIPVTISSITATAGVVTANFSSALNNTVTAGMTIHIVGVTGSGSGWNGVWTVASAPSTSQVTFNVSGATGTGTVSGSSTGRVSNVAIITAISRAANGVISITTAQNHNFQVGASSFKAAEFQIEGCTPTSLDGYYVIASASGTSITCNSGVLNNAVTGSVTAGSSIATVWEFTIVACPQLVAPTIGYYIYSDSPNPGGALGLIGKVPLGDCNFTDWGPSLATGYAAPSYVPTTPPVSAQAQLYTGTVVSGGGTTSLVLSANLGQTIPSLGATIMFDDGPNLIAAMNVAAGSNSIAGSVLLSPPGSASNFSQYIFNSPIQIPENINLIFGCGCLMNETWTLTAFNQVSAQFGSSNVLNMSFGLLNYVNNTGIASPFFFLGESLGNTGGVYIDGLGFTFSSNGQIGIISTCFYTRVSNCGFKGAGVNANQGTMMAIVYLGSSSLSEVESLNILLHNRFYGNGIPGQSAWGPARLPSIWLRGSTNTALPNFNDNTGQFFLRGRHSWNARGITFDQYYSQGNGNQPQATIQNIWMQQGTTPVVSCIGDIFYGYDILDSLNDTSQTPILFNGALNAHDFSIRNSSTSIQSVVSGNQVFNLTASGNTFQNQFQCQRILSISLTTTSATSDVVSIPGFNVSGQVSITPTNATAAADIASGNVYILSKGSQQVTVAHSAISGMTFDLLATVGN